jgi:hypothetical protein
VTSPKLIPTSVTASPPRVRIPNGCCDAAPKPVMVGGA